MKPAHKIAVRWVRLAIIAIAAGNLPSLALAQSAGVSASSPTPSSPTAMPMKDMTSRDAETKGNLPRMPGGGDTTHSMGGGGDMKHAMGGGDMMQSMTGMHAKMQAMTMSGDPDHDFATLMRLHHQGAIDMAQMELDHGKNPTMRDRAKKIIAAQKAEIAEFEQWIDKHRLTASPPAAK